MDKQKIGKLGEEIASRYLKNKGYKILERNYQKEGSPVSKGEIDIIAKKDDIIIFIEVKTLQQNQPSPAFDGAGFFPEDRVDFRKRRKLIKLSESWLIKNKIPLEARWQIDIIALEINRIAKKAEIRHFKNAVF